MVIFHSYGTVYQRVYKVVLPHSFQSKGSKGSNFQRVLHSWNHLKPSCWFFSYLLRSIYLGGVVSFLVGEPIRYGGWLLGLPHYPYVPCWVYSGKHLCLIAGPCTWTACHRLPKKSGLAPEHGMFNSSTLKYHLPQKSESNEINMVGSVQLPSKYQLLSHMGKLTQTSLNIKHIWNHHWLYIPFNPHFSWLNMVQSPFFVIYLIPTSIPHEYRHKTYVKPHWTIHDIILLMVTLQ